MPTFIKTGFWEKKSKGFKDWLNLEELISLVVPSSSLTNSEVAAIQTANAPSAVNPVATMADLQPLVYTAFISQTSTGAPTSSTLKNTLDTITYSRTGAGVYNVISAGSKFTATKTVPGTATQVGFDLAGNKYTAQQLSTSVIEIKTYAEADLETPVDGILNNTPFYIEVYP